ncbi:metal-dependent transcriptional regulator [Sulfoacidibacillus thermotolerans]|uniref:Manganese transport regulator n=1 Tax=Sulfoacidibacillus thermotolerans TaxID=1765684 RepID=A0A2U3DBM7_SULT2|nr:metal-dependent transcriptional regulator [Sulfoacidibacillus thermotolerans]PWI58689.1 hypothetical protein BM613_00905 [Sulfoacidibacillus thermotolerans]
MKRNYAVDTYLEAIAILSAEGVVVIAARLAEYLKVSRPTVTQMMKRLVAAGLVEIHEGKEIFLSARGQQQANASLRRHRLLERFLCDVLQLDWGTAHLEASRLGHCLSPIVEEKLDEMLHFPTTCPHGNAIPGSNSNVLQAFPLSTWSPSNTLEIVRIFEQAEENVELLRELQSHGFLPGQKVSIITNNPKEAKLAVSLQGKTVELTRDVAERIMVSVVANE